MKTFIFGSLTRNWFLAGTLGVVVAGFLLPGLGDLAGKSPSYLVPVVMLLSGMHVGTGELVRGTRNLKGILLAFALVYVAAPALAYALGVLLSQGGGLAGTGRGGSPDARVHLVALMIMAAQSSTIASAVILTGVAGGDRALAILVTLFNNLATVVATPLVLKVSVGADVAFPAARLAGDMALRVALPVLVGQFLRPFLWGRCPGLEPLAREIPKGIILVFLYSAVAIGSRPLSEEPDLIFSLGGACIALHACLLGMGWALGRALALGRGERIAVLFTGSQKTLPAGMLTWRLFFSGNPYAGIPLFFYHAFQLVADSLLASFLRRGR